MTIALKGAALACSLFVVAVSPLRANGNELSGTVRDVCGLTLPGTSISVANESGPTARAAADGSGHFFLKALAAGQWTITFELLGFQTLKQDIRLQQNGDATQLNVRLLPDLLMKRELGMSHEDPKVRYRKFSVYGVVKARSGEPISAATVLLRDVGSRKNRGTDQCTTDELGRYAIIGWSPSETKWQLSVQAEGFRAYTQTDLALTPDEPRAIDLVIEKLKPQR